MRETENNPSADPLPGNPPDAGKALRWKRAIHESGHAAWAIGCTGRPPDEMRLGPAGGGCRLRDDWSRSGFAWAVMCAVGRAAEGILETYPDPPPVSSQPVAPIRGDPGPGVLFDEVTGTPSDDRLLALWAIGGCAASPETWEPRVMRARREAELFVLGNAGFILRLARALYLLGAMTPEDFREQGFLPGADETKPAGGA